MATLTIDWNTKIITVPISFLTLISGGGGAGSLYELDLNAFRLDLKDIEDDADGMTNDDTHRHVGETVLSGVTYARIVEIINNYTVTFEELGGGAHYTVRCVGANHNLADVLNFNSVNLIIGNSAGLITVVQGSGVTSQDKTDIINGVWNRAVESGLTAEEIIRVMLAALSGTSTGVGTSNELYKSRDGVTTRIDATFDANGNRTSVNVDGT